eukprot:5601748-Amphidinium_carterae.1
MMLQRIHHIAGVAADISACRHRAPLEFCPARFKNYVHLRITSVNGKYLRAKNGYGVPPVTHESLTIR